jgi:hypothetical protein
VPLLELEPPLLELEPPLLELEPPLLELEPLLELALDSEPLLELALEPELEPLSELALDPELELPLLDSPASISELSATVESAEMLEPSVSAASWPAGDCAELSPTSSPQPRLLAASPTTAAAITHARPLRTIWGFFMANLHRMGNKRKIFRSRRAR